MKKLMIGMFCTMPLGAMDFEEKPTPQEQRQLIITNRGTTLEQFSEIMKQRPNLNDVKITGHQITHVPDVGITFWSLQYADLSNGTLGEYGGAGIMDLLKIAPNLMRLNVARNKLKQIGQSNTIYSNFSELDCSYNQIKSVDFTNLCGTGTPYFPNLTKLNLSYNATLIEFKTEGFTKSLSRTVQGILEIDLRSTGLFDATKKEILGNSQQTFDAVVFGVGGGAVLGAFSDLPINITTKLALELKFGLMFGIGPVIGAAIGYFMVLGGSKPESRIKTIYKPILDDADYPEAETRSRYFRFVKDFPSIWNITKCCRAQDPEYEPISQGDEQA